MCKKIIFILFFCLSVTKVFAIQKIYIFHINGIQNTEEKARENRDALDKYADLHSNIIANNGHIDLLYNKIPNVSCTLCEQLMDTFSQKYYENLTVDDFVEAYIKDKKLDIKPGSDDYENLKANIGEKYYDNPFFMGENYLDIYHQFKAKVPDDSYLLQYLKQGSSGEKPFVLFVAHSQGNLYANSLYKELTEKEGYTKYNLSIYGIASPATTNLGNFISQTYYKDHGYITSLFDGVINALRIYVSFEPLLYGSIAVPNISIPKGNDIPRHGLIDTYLNDPTAREIIVRNINYIAHYFWMSAIYDNLPDSMGSLEYYRKLKPEFHIALTQDEGSSVSVESLTVNGKCIKSNPYFLAKDNISDNTLGVGYQCVLATNKSLPWTMVWGDGFSNNNRLRIRFTWGGWVSSTSVYHEIVPELINNTFQNVCKNSYKFTYLRSDLYRNANLYVIAPPQSDLSCEHYGMTPYGKTRDDILKLHGAGDISFN